MPQIYVDQDPNDPMKNCNGCRMCEVICAFTHEKTCNPTKSRIKIVSVPPLIDVPILCRQCKRPPCVRNCPVNAIAKAANGSVVIDEKKCIGCGKCEEACPFHAVNMHPRRDFPLICDLCGGKPKCVEYCPTGILKLSNSEIHSEKRRRLALEYATPILKSWGMDRVQDGGK